MQIVTQKILKLLSKMPICQYMWENMRYAHFAKIMRKMWQSSIWVKLTCLTRHVSFMRHLKKYVDHINTKYAV